MAEIPSTGLWGETPYDSLLGAKPTAAGVAEPEARKINNQLDKDAFLHLLVTQLRYQDPLNPVDDKEFIGQMAQLTSLEQMQNMNKSMMQQQAFGMIGKYVEGSNYNAETSDYDVVSGEVTSVSMKNGEVVLQVGDKDLALEAVEIVKDPNNMSNSLSNINNSLVTSQNLALIGKHIQALTLDDKMNVTGYVEGMVDYVKLNNGNVVLMVGDKEVFAHEVVSVADDMMLLGKAVDVELESGELLSGGTIQDVIIKEGKAYLLVDDREVYISKINYPSEALALIGENISYEELKGTVESVVIKNGVPYMRVGGKEISYKDYRGIE